MEDMSKKSCIIYDSWGELIANLPDEMAGQLIKQIIGYVFDMEAGPADNPAIGAMFAMIKTKLDADADAYEETIRQRSEAGKRGMSKRWNNESITNDNTVITNDNTVITPITNDNETITNITVSVSDSVSVSDKDIKEKDKKKKFIKPSVEEVRAYCQERNNGVDPETFVDFYESKGWKVGNNPMKDWKAAVRTWEKRNPNQDSNPTNEVRPSFNPSPMSDIPKSVYDKVHNYPERKIDYAALEAEVFNSG